MNPIRAVVFAGIALIAGCGEKKDRPISGDPRGIELVYAGATPRAPVRYALTPGTSVDVELELDVELDAGGRGGPLPTVILATSIATERALPDGTQRVRVTVESIRAREVANSALSVDAMTEHMQLLVGTSLVGTLSPDGGIGDLHAEAAQRIPPALEQQLASVAKSFQQIALPLPLVPIGDGAAWRLKRTIEQNGMTLYAVTTVVASSIRDGVITFTSSTSLGGPDQTVTLSGTPIEMTAIGGIGTAKGTLDLTKMVMTGESSLAFHSDMRAGGETDAMAMTLTTRVAPGRLPERAAAPAAPSADLPPPEDLGAPDNTEASGENESVTP